MTFSNTSRPGISLPAAVVAAGATVIFTLVNPVDGFAQELKVGYVASEAILERLPQAIEARTKLAELQSKWRREISAYELKADDLRQEIERNRLLWSAQERNKKEGELKDILAGLASYRSEKFGPSGEFETKYSELMSPVIDLVMAAVRAEADDQDFDYVFDKSSRGLPMLFANSQYDLTVAVLGRLGVEIDPSELEREEEKPDRILPESMPFQVDRSSSPNRVDDPDRTTRPIEMGEESQVRPSTDVDPNRLINPPEEEDPEDDDDR